VRDSPATTLAPCSVMAAGSLAMATLMVRTVVVPAASSRQAFSTLVVRVT
jgi:hypothetical protein